jgi:DNA polymerase elongation subunit (family B)
MILHSHMGSIPILRKLFTYRDCKFATWFNIKGRETNTELDDRLSIDGTKLRPIKEYVVNWQTMQPIDSKICENWKSLPTLLAIDIETYTDNHAAMPNPFDSLHVVYMCSCIYQQLGDKSTRRKFGIIMGECNDIPGCEIRSVTSEIDLINELAKLTLELDPDILTGYNIWKIGQKWVDQ